MRHVSHRKYQVSFLDTAVHRFTGYDVAYESWYEGNPNSMIEHMQYLPVEWADVGVGARGYCLGYEHPLDGHYARWEKCKPTMATRANMFVFLAELTDIKRMFNVIPRRHLSIDSWGELRKRLTTPISKRGLKSSLRYANSQHLNYNFGWRPFIADIVAVKRAYESYEKRLYKFLYNANRLVKLHASDDPTGIDTISLVPLYGQTRHWKEVRVTGTAKLTSTFQLLYETPAYSKQELRVRAWLDSVGLNVTPAALWELIPFSFVVDWVYDVGSKLETISSDWIQPWIMLVQSCTSVKLDLKVQVSYCHGPSSADIRVRLPGVVGKYSAYSRRVAMPYDSGIRDLDSDKIRLFASLVAARF